MFANFDRPSYLLLLLHEKSSQDFPLFNRRNSVIQIWKNMSRLKHFILNYVKYYPGTVVMHMISFCQMSLWDDDCVKIRCWGWINWATPGMWGCYFSNSTSTAVKICPFNTMGLKKALCPQLIRTTLPPNCFQMYHQVHFVLFNNFITYLLTVNLHHFNDFIAEIHTWSFSCSVCKGLLPDLTEKLFQPEICSEATNTQQMQKMRNGNRKIMASKAKHLDIH